MLSPPILILLGGNVERPMIGCSGSPRNLSGRQRRQ
jgi:hypothetical protein